MRYDKKISKSISLEVSVHKWFRHRHDLLPKTFFPCNDLHRKYSKMVICGIGKPNPIAFVSF